LALLLSLSFFVVSSIQEAAANPSGEGWTKTYGGTLNDFAWGLVQTADGGYALAGSTPSYNPGYGDYNDILLVKTDSTGNALWNRTYGGVYSDSASALVQTVDGGYALAGHTDSSGTTLYGDFWLVRTDSAGNELWNKTYGTEMEMDEALDLVQTADGGYALAGNTRSYGAGARDLWLVKTDASGNTQWDKTYGGTDNDFASALVQTADGGYAVTGYTSSFGIGQDAWLVKTNSAGNTLWQKNYGGTNNDGAADVVQTADGGYALAGWTYSYGDGSGDYWLVKTDSAGNIQWKKTYGGSGSDAAYALVQTADGGFALVGTRFDAVAANYDSWLVRTDSAGNELWNVTYGGAGLDQAVSLVQTSDGGYAFAGGTGSFGAGGTDFWLVKTDEFGAVPEFSQALLLPLLTILVLLIVGVRRRIRTVIP
jgi:hypothetical protein